MNNTSANTIYTLAILCFIIVCGEYYFLTLEPINSIIYKYSLNFFAKAGFFCRSLFILFYVLSFSFQRISLAKQLSNSKSKKARKTGPKTYVIWGAVFVCTSLALCTVHLHDFYKTVYPLALIGLIPSGYWVGKMLRRKSLTGFGIQNDRRKIENEYSFNFKCQDGSYVNVPNPFRGNLVIGGAGAGKSYSIAEPMIEQGADKGYCGILYDFKFPTLTNFAYAHYSRVQSDVKFWIINFQDLNKTHRVNPLNPKYMPVSAYASEYALAIINNLMPESIEKPDFWIRSSNAYLTSIIWFLKKYYPQHCTIPHVVNLVVSQNYETLLNIIKQDYECASMIRSIATAVENESADQISGVISSLQVVLAKINSPEMCYVLSGDDFSLDLNDPNNPKYLCIGTSPTLVDTFSPVVSCICTVALKLMNQQGKRHSYIMLDEGPTLYIPKLDVVPATARSNKVATIYMAQDFSQMKKEYGQNQAEAIISNLNNQFFGRVASLQTAEYVSKIFGREDRLMTNESNNYSRPNSIGFDLSQRTHAGSTGAGISYSLQERQLIKPQEVLNLEVGQFVGTTVETDSPNFSAYIERDKIAIPEQLKNGIPDFASNIDVTSNYMRIILEVKAILNGKLQPEVPFASYID